MKYRKYPPTATINRLARYLNYLTQLPPENLRISSQQISEALNIKPTQFRQDFHYFGGFGKPGKGYDRKDLINVLERILGVDKTLGMVVFGAGHLGTALANYKYFEKMNLKIRGLFDVNPKVIGLSIRGIEIMHPDKLNSFTQNNHVKIGIITTPSEAAQATCDCLVNADVKGIWNFSPIRVKVPEGFILRNERPSLGLLALTFSLNQLQYENHNDQIIRKAFSFD